jgi:soluble lytic murein transglycosylase
LLQVIFPIDYWPLIRKHSGQRGVDPYLAAALIAQESTFQADARSAANAWGLMQIVPATGRRLARAEGLRRFRASQLTVPEVNVRLGMRYLSGLLDEFGGAHFALASYNAGESRVARWQAERPGWSREEFIDDIPFPETQNYVKRILGTAEDYRRLYGERGAVPVPIARRATAPAVGARNATLSDGATARTKSTKATAKKGKGKSTGKGPATSKTKPRRSGV